jgi:hypothetical protein
MDGLELIAAAQRLRGWGGQACRRLFAWAVAYIHWLLLNSFQDLSREIRQALEEAYLYNGMVARAGGIRTWAELQAIQQELRGEARSADAGCG